MFSVLKLFHKHRILLFSSCILIFFITEINGLKESHHHAESFNSRLKRETNSSSIHHDCSPLEASPGTKYEDVRKNLIRVKCDDKYVQKISGSPFLACINSQWSPKQMCIHKPDKPSTPSEPKAPLPDRKNPSQSIKHDCTPPELSEGTSYDDIKRNIIRIRCDKNYVQQNTDSPYISCINGKWSPMQICIYQEPSKVPFGNYEGCGILQPSVPLLVNSKNANPIEHPWNAALYRKLRNGTQELFCGGSLITPYSIITAAHCTEDMIQPEYMSRYKVVLGKTYRTYDHPKDIKAAQYLDVEKIYQAELYQGLPSKFTSDIAIWELKTPAIINYLVIPVCIDLERKHKLETNMTGKVAGWGKTSPEKGSESEILKEAVIRYKAYEECVKNLPGTDRASLPIDKSCTTIESGSVHVVQGGDSGAGFVFEIGERHYIYGIVSTNLKFTIVSSFTNLAIQPHIDFISRILKQISQNKTPKS